MKKWLNKIIHQAGYSVVKNPVSPLHEYRNEPEFIELLNLCKPYTMTSVERMYALYKATLYVLENNLPGAFVECGVWRGGSAMLVAKMLNNRKITDRHLYLYDTFEGMSAPTKADMDFRGKDAAVLLDQNVDQKETSVWCLADLNEVKHNMGLTGYAKELTHYVEGKVEDTIPATIPSEGIALLRLDTDWYESTWHELVHLYPLLVNKGVLVIDDYGHWEGCRKAVDEYFEKEKVPMLLNRIDYTGRIGIKV
jgi:hypothetical protein